MNKEINYLGYSAVPSDYDVPDGHLAMSLNLIHEDGAINPILQPTPLFSVGNGHRIFVHRAGSFSNYLSWVQGAHSISWIATVADQLLDSPQTIDLGSDAGTINNVVAVGYIVVVSTSNNIYYIRFDASKKQYVCLGSKIPDINLDLALELNLVSRNFQSDDDTLEIIDNAGSGDDSATGDDDWRLIVSTTYELSVKNGDLTPDNYTGTSSQSGWVATPKIALPDSLVLNAGIEYKLQAYLAFGNISSLRIRFYGVRDGASAPELIGMLIPDIISPSGTTLSKKLITTDRFTNISYSVEVRAPEGSPIDRLKGTVEIFKGIDSSASGSDSVAFHIKYTREAYDFSIGCINKFIRESVTAKSRFIFPFLARYAVRLYNGSYSFISQPVLMIPNSGYAPCVRFTSNAVSGMRQLNLSAFAADLSYRLRDSIPDQWNDLIAAIDIFVSKPIWSYDQGAEYDPETNLFGFSNTTDSIGFGRLRIDGNAPSDVFSATVMSDIINRYLYDNSNGETRFLTVARRPDDDRRKDFLAVANFYKVGSIDLHDASPGEFTTLEIEKGLTAQELLVTQPTLADDILHYQGFADAYIRDYNNRLHICHSRVILPAPPSPDGCADYIGTIDSLPNPDLSISVYVWISTDDGVRILRDDAPFSHLGLWYFYPDNRATQVAFLQKYNGKVIRSDVYPLRQHDHLNGAYWFCGNFKGVYADEQISDDTRSDADLDQALDDLLHGTDDPYESLILPGNNSVSALSTIYVSEVNCPFVFTATAAVAIGAQEVVAISCAARPLSQGQFGQFPLYAFSTEGIWAISVSDSGLYTAVQPIVRDQTVNIDSITQIDSAVLFASRRGIMMLSGNQTACISDPVNSSRPFDITTLHAMPRLWSLLSIPGECPSIGSFPDFIKDCRMIYDYPHQRIVIFNPALPYAFIYSLKSKAWGMIVSSIQSNVNSYPDALAVDQAGMLVNLSADSVPLPTPLPGLLVSRPLKLDAPDTLKTVDSVIQRGFFRKGALQSVLYGSRDLFEWFPVWSSHDHIMRGFSGSPYKYFRILLICRLDPGESIAGCSVRFNPRLTNHPR